MERNGKIFIIIIVIAIVVFAAIFGGMNVLNNAGKTDTQISREETVQDLAKYVERKVTVYEKPNPIKGTVDLESNSLSDELPDINNYPFKVKGTGEINIEIFSSPEKAGSETSTNDPKANVWLLNVAKDFNKQGYTINGKTVSVSVRSVSSGLASDYIASGKYVPDAFSPSNKAWGSMLQAKGVNLHLEADSLVGNVAGIVISKETYEKLMKTYGAVNINTVIEATVKNEIAMGYTNPYASSTGLNFLMSSLYCFDPNNPLSDEAIAGFQAFQANVPVVSYNTTQMQGAINSGVLDGMIIEHQTFVNTPELRNYVFIPFGVRHDNPLYSIDGLSSEKQQAVALFAEFATNESSQKSAREYGFGEYDNYVSEIPETDGTTLLNAQDIWKEKKDNGQEIVTVFVVDTSGSVAGAPLNRMKSSLINAAQYINPDHFVGLVTYNSDVTINLPIGQFDLNHRAYFNGEIENLSAGGGTRTYNAIAVALQMLENARAEHPNAKFMLFVLSDGESDGLLREVSPFIENLNIPVYTIGYNANIAALQEISKINEAASINADTDDIIYVLKNLFNSQM